MQFKIKTLLITISLQGYLWEKGPWNINTFHLSLYFACHCSLTSFRTILTCLSGAWEIITLLQCLLISFPFSFGIYPSLKPFQVEHYSKPLATSINGVNQTRASVLGVQSTITIWIIPLSYFQRPTDSKKLSLKPYSLVEGFMRVFFQNKGKNQFINVYL